MGVFIWSIIAAELALYDSKSINLFCLVNDINLFTVVKLNLDI